MLILPTGPSVFTSMSFPFSVLIKLRSDCLTEESMSEGKRGRKVSYNRIIEILDGRILGMLCLKKCSSYGRHAKRQNCLCTLSYYSPYSIEQAGGVSNEIICLPPCLSLTLSLLSICLSAYVCMCIYLSIYSSIFPSI